MTSTLTTPAAKGGLEYVVKDLSLAEWGRKEIRLAEQEMPGLMALRAQHAGKKPLAGARRVDQHDRPFGNDRRESLWWCNRVCRIDDAAIDHYAIGIERADFGAAKMQQPVKAQRGDLANQARHIAVALDDRHKTRLACQLRRYSSHCKGGQVYISRQPGA